jgi:hypothetical protein
MRGFIERTIPPQRAVLSIRQALYVGQRLNPIVARVRTLCLDRHPVVRHGVVSSCSRGVLVVVVVVGAIHGRRVLVLLCRVVIGQAIRPKVVEIQTAVLELELRHAAPVLVVHAAGGPYQAV